jgi:hypothetical protein
MKHLQREKAGDLTAAAVISPSLRTLRAYAYE